MFRNMSALLCIIKFSTHVLCKINYQVPEGTILVEESKTDGLILLMRGTKMNNYSSVSSSFCLSSS